MMKSPKLTIFNAFENTMSPREAGGKAWNLHRLTAEGFPVAPWCVVSSRVFEEITQPMQKQFHALITRTDCSDQESVSGISRTMTAMMRSRVSQNGLRDKIMDAVGSCFRHPEYLAVRSSVVGEDSIEHSFAGLMDSYLFVPFSEIMPAILAVWDSAFSPRALLYRHRKGIGFDDVSMAVILQEMVQASVSGVLFTRDPQSRERSCTISAAYGLGEGVVANRVETDLYVLDGEGRQLKREIAVKEHQIVRDEDRQSGTVLQPVPAERRSHPALTDDQLQLLRLMGMEAEQFFGAPQDVEWAFDESGQCFLLQSRPIVFPPADVCGPVMRIWESSNIVESYPGITLPLTYSFVRNAYEESFRKAAAGFFPFGRLPRKAAPLFKNLIGLLEGRVYYNLLAWYEMLSYLPGFSGYKKSWDAMIGITKSIEFPETAVPSVVRIFSWIIAAARLLMVRRTARKFSRQFQSFYDEYGTLDLSSKNEDALIGIYESMKMKLTGFWHLTLFNDFAAMKFYDWLVQMCQRLGSNKFPNLHNDLLCGQHEVESVKPVRSLLRIARVVRDTPSFTKLFGSDDHDGIWRDLQTDANFEKLRTLVEDHLTLYGDRGIEELKLERPTFRDEPASLIAIIKTYVRADISDEMMQKHEEEVRRNAEGYARQLTNNPLDRILLAFILRMARQAIANRENMRFSRTRMFGIMRRLFRRMGKLFVQQGLLCRSDDVYYLSVEEIFGIVQGTAMTLNLHALVELRKKEYELFAVGMPEERVETRGIPSRGRVQISGGKPDQDRRLHGIGCSGGIVQAAAIVVADPRSPIEVAGKIIIARSTDPGWVFLMISSKGIIVEKGSVLSHTAIIGRELGIPTVVGVNNATSLIPSGSMVELDGTTGVIQWE